jgi:hypothetical protein
MPDQMRYQPAAVDRSAEIQQRTQLGTQAVEQGQVSTDALREALRQNRDTYATSAGRTNALGDQAVEQGRLSTEGMRDALTRDRNTYKSPIDQAAFSRGEVSKDDQQGQQSYLGLLNALRSGGFIGGDESASQGGMSASGTWSPTWAPYQEGAAGSSAAGPSAFPSAQAPAARFAPIQAVDTSGAQAAAFARAKDQVGQTASGALAGLRSSLGGRGMLGSGGESRGAAGVVNRGQGELGDVSRQQAIESADLAQRTAEFNYSGGVNQRGQDMSAAEAARGQDLAARGQDLSAAQARADRRLAARGQDLGARGQDLSSRDAASARAAQARQARLDAVMGLYRSFGSRPGAGTVY